MRAAKGREAPAIRSKEWPCVEFSQIDVNEPEAVAEFILWLCGVQMPVPWPNDFNESEELAALESPLESAWSWRGAPRKRMAKLCWQLLVQNNSREYFEQFFTYDLAWLKQQVAQCKQLLSPIQSKLRGVFEGFQERRKTDVFIGQGRVGEEWLLPPDQSDFVRSQLNRCRPDLIEESSNYEDYLRYYILPYFEVMCVDPGRVYVGEHRQNGGTHVQIESSTKETFALPHGDFPFRWAPGTNFSWGYAGSGPSELSLSILADTTGGDLEIAKRLKFPFRDEVLSMISWNGNLRIARKSVLKWLQTKNIGKQELNKSQIRIDELRKTHAKDLAEHKERLSQIRLIGGLRMQRFDIVAPDFESSLYVDLMQMFQHASWVLHCSHCGQPVACESSPRGNRQRARWIAGHPVYHERCFVEHRRTLKRSYWARRSEDASFREAERKRARKRRLRKPAVGDTKQDVVPSEKRNIG